MVKRLSFVLLIVSGTALFAGGALRIADASGCGITALNAAALKLAVEDNTAASVDRVTPGEAKDRLKNGRADLIVLAHNDLPEKKYVVCRMFAAEVLAVYVHAGNPVKNISIRELRDILTDTRPGWGMINPVLRNDIHRFGLDSRAAGHQLAERLLGVSTPSKAIFKVSSAREVILLVRNDPDSLGFIPLQADAGSGVKLLKVQDTAPDPDAVRSGRYLLSRRYYIIAPEKISSAAEKFLRYLNSGAFAVEMEKNGFMAF